MKKTNKRKVLLFLTIFLFLTICIFGLNNKMFATDNSGTSVESEEVKVATVNSIFDIKGINGEYRTSSENDNIYLPFFRNAVGRIEVDKEVGKLGMFSSSSTIDVNAPLKNIQFLFSSDTIRINADVEYCIAWSANDVVINSNISKNVIIFAGGTVTIGENAKINDDVIIVAKSVNIKGEINGSAIVSASSLNVSGNIKNDLRCEISTIELASNDNVKGNLYVNTYNKDLNIKDKYQNAIVNIKEKNKVSKSFGNILLKAVISSLAFTLIYLIVKKVSKGKVHEKMLSKAKNNTLFVVLSGAISLLAFPALFIFLLLISIMGLYMITVPVLVTYVAFLIVFVILSIYVVGSTIFEYTNKKYIKAEKLSIELIGIFFTFLSLNLICKIPTIGTYIYMAIVMIAIGIMIAYFLKKDKDIKEK